MAVAQGGAGVPAGALTTDKNVCATLRMPMLRGVAGLLRCAAMLRGRLNTNKKLINVGGAADQLFCLLPENWRTLRAVGGATICTDGVHTPAWPLHPQLVGRSFLIYGQGSDWRLAGNGMKAINRSVTRGFTRSDPTSDPAGDPEPLPTTNGMPL